MISTNDFISQLVSGSAPTGHLPSPARRVMTWLVLSLPYVVIVALLMGLRDDLAQKAGESRFLIEQAAVLITAVLAAFAALCVVVPGRPKLVWLLPLVPLTIWLGSLGLGCVEALLQGNLAFATDWQCLPRIATVGLIPALVMAAMLRRGAPLYPRLAVALGGLAAAAMGTFGLRLFHPTDASLMVLVWQFGTVALITAMACCFGPFVHNWKRSWQSS